MAGLLVLDLLCCQRLQLSLAATTSSPAASRPLAADLWRLMALPRVVVFVAWCTLVGILTALVWQWLPWFLTDLAGLRAQAQVRILEALAPPGRGGVQGVTRPSPFLF